jgi:hypothetical protein
VHAKASAQNDWSGNAQLRQRLHCHISKILPGTVKHLLTGKVSGVSGVYYQTCLLRPVPASCARRMEQSDQLIRMIQIACG